MLDWNEKEASAIVALQRGLPLKERPFAAIGESCGLTETAILDLLLRLTEAGDVRRFGGVFDARRLGYHSALCSLLVPRDRLPDVAAHVVALPGVTHAYERGWPEALPRDSEGGPAGREWPNLWFTLAEPGDTFAPSLAALRTACEPFAIEELPALRRFKIDVVFDLRTRDRDERVEPLGAPIAQSSSVYVLNAAERSLVRRLQGDLPPQALFFRSLAEEAGISEAELLNQLRAWRSSGVLRRIGLLLKHREIGFKANGMCCWNVPAAEVAELGRRVAAFPEVTHCYERPPTERFPFRLYAMIHTPTWAGTQALFARISRETGLSDGQLLLSLTEFKKTSMQFF
jgi:DNA-binding Lrp family transcriptional regulator